MFKLDQSLRPNREAVLKTESSSASTVNQLSVSRQEPILSSQAVPGEKVGGVRSTQPLQEAIPVRDSHKEMGAGGTTRLPVQTSNTVQQNECSVHSTELNSYKFSKPRVYVANDYKSLDRTNLDLLRDISLKFGGKIKSKSYDHMINGLLATEFKRKRSKRLKPVVLNSITSSIGEMKMLQIHLNNQDVGALADTGSSHSLITVETFNRLKITYFEPVEMVMRVAGSSLKNNVIGKTTLDFLIYDKDRNPVKFVHEFLVAHHLNNYDAIFGADFLLNPAITVAITPESVLIRSAGTIFSIPIFSKITGESRVHLLSIQSDLIIEGSQSKIITCNCSDFNVGMSQLIDSNIVDSTLTH